MNPANWPPVPQGLDQSIPVWGVDTVGVIEPKPIRTPLPEVKWRERFDGEVCEEQKTNPLIDEMDAAMKRIEERGGEPKISGCIGWVPKPEADLLREVDDLKGQIEKFKAQARHKVDKAAALSKLRDRVWNLAQDLKRAVNGVGVD